MHRQVLQLAANYQTLLLRRVYLFENPACPGLAATLSLTTSPPKCLQRMRRPNLVPGDRFLLPEPMTRRHGGSSINQ